MTIDPLQNLVLTIGAMKAGTTSLHHYMSVHPEVSMAPVKEPDFFKDDQYNGHKINEYRGLLMMGINTRRNVRVFGETSTSYSKYPYVSGVPRRIITHSPTARFIYVLRDPIERLVSHYMHNVIRGREIRPLEVAVSDISTKSDT